MTKETIRGVDTVRDALTKEELEARGFMKAAWGSMMKCYRNSRGEILGGIYFPAYKGSGTFNPGKGKPTLTISELEFGTDRNEWLRDMHRAIGEWIEDMEALGLGRKGE